VVVAKIDNRNDEPLSGDPYVEQPNPASPAGTPAQDDAGKGQQREVRVRIDDSKRTTGYANGFRSSLTEAEVVIDLGVNLLAPGGQRSAETPAAHLTFEIQHRAIMNYTTR